MKPRPGQVYTLDGKHWRVVRNHDDQTATVENIFRRSNTARLPWRLFKTEALSDYDWRERP